MHRRCASIKEGNSRTLLNPIGNRLVFEWYAGLVCSIFPRFSTCKEFETKIGSLVCWNPWVDRGVASVVSTEEALPPVFFFLLRTALADFFYLITFFPMKLTTSFVWWVTYFTGSVIISPPDMASFQSLQLACSSCHVLNTPMLRNIIEVFYSAVM